MAASFLCRVSGVFHLRRATTRPTWARFYSDTEPEPLTLRQQSDGIRYPDRGCHVNAVSEIKFLHAKFVIYREKLPSLSTTILLLLSVPTFLSLFFFNLLK